MAVFKNGLRVQCASKSEGQFIAEEIFEEGVYCSHGVTVGACALLLRRPFSRFFAQLPQGALVFDIGANVGMFTLKAALSATKPLLGGKSTTIVAFEPSRANFSLLARNVATNAPIVGKVNAREALLDRHPADLTRGSDAQESCKVLLVRLGAHKHATSSTLTYYPAMPGNSTLRPFEKLHQRHAMNPAAWKRMFVAHLESVRLVRLSDFLRRHWGYLAKQRGHRVIDLLKVQCVLHEL